MVFGQKLYLSLCYFNNKIWIFYVISYIFISISYLFFIFLYIRIPRIPKKIKGYRMVSFFCVQKTFTLSLIVFRDRNDYIPI